MVKRATVAAAFHQGALQTDLTQPAAQCRLELPAAGDLPAVLHQGDALDAVRGKGPGKPQGLVTTAEHKAAAQKDAAERRSAQ